MIYWNNSLLINIFWNGQNKIRKRIIMKYGTLWGVAQMVRNVPNRGRERKRGEKEKKTKGRDFIQSNGDLTCLLCLEERVWFFLCLLHTDMIRIHSDMALCYASPHMWSIYRVLTFFFFLKEENWFATKKNKNWIEIYRKISTSTFISLHYINYFFLYILHFIICLTFLKWTWGISYPRVKN